MRVSKLVREYIEKEVHEILEQKYNYPSAKYSELLDKNAQLNHEFHKNIEQYITRECEIRGYKLRTSRYDRGCSISLFFDTELNEEIEKYNNLINQIKHEQEQKVEEILINLELGGTKADLDRMLQELRG